MFQQSPNGTIYIDRIGTKVVQWDAAMGSVVIESGMGGRWTLQRMAPAAATGGASGGAGGDLAGQIASLAALHAQGVLSDAEFEAAKSNLLGNTTVGATAVVVDAVPAIGGAPYRSNYGGVEMARVGLVANQGATPGSLFATHVRA